MAKKNYNTEDSTLWKVIGVAGNAIFMNLAFVVCCIPIVTIGPAFCALFSAIRFFIRGDSWFDGFKKGISNNFWRVTGIWTVLLAVGVFVGNDVALYIKDYSAANIKNTGYILSLSVSSLILLVILMFVSALLIYNVYFPNKIMDLLTETASFIFSAPLHVLACAALLWFPIFLFFGLPGTFYEFMLVFIFLYFTAAAFGTTVILKKPLIKVLNAKRESEKENGDETEENS